MTIGEALKEERVKVLHYTQRQMIKGTSISISHYSKIENNIQEIKAVDLFNLLNERNIDFVSFKKRLEDNSEKSNFASLADELTFAFYKPDLNKAKQVKKEIDKLNDAEELKIRAELVVAVLSNNLDNEKGKLSEHLVTYFSNNNQWTENADMLRIIGNSTRIIDFNTLNTLMDKIFNHYIDVDSFSLETQKRIGNIFANYLHVLYDYKASMMAKKYVSFLKNLPEIPELVLDKLMGYYYEATFNHDAKELNEILKELNRVVPKVVKCLPVN